MFPTEPHLAKTYNSLRGVVAANEEVSAKKIPIDLIAQAIGRYELEDAVSIRLLHKHNRIAPYERMVERSFFDADGFGLATQAYESLPQGVSIVPNSWQHATSGWTPIEFSERKLLVRPIVNPEIYPEFFAFLAEILTAYDLAELIGPALKYGPLVTEHRPSDEWFLLEKTDSAHRANIMRFARRTDALQTQTIHTKWSAVSSLAGTVWSAEIECACSGKHHDQEMREAVVEKRSEPWLPASSCERSPAHRT
jgi:hypothetical protein